MATIMNDMPRHEDIVRLLQADRLLRMHFPHGDGPQATLVVNTLFAQEELSRGFRFDAELLSDDASIPLKDMIAKMITVSLVRDNGTERHFNGYVTEFRYLRTDGGFVYYYVTLEPWLAFAKLRKDSMTFLNRGVLEITEKVLAEYPLHDWKVRVRGEDPKISYANQYNETDYNHLHRRWEAAGLYYWYEHRIDGHTLWLSDDSSVADTVDACAPYDVEPGSIPFRADSGSAERDGIRQWQAVRRVGSTSLSVGSFDYKRPVPLVATSFTKNRQGNIGEHAVYENLGAYAFRTTTEAEDLAQRRLEDVDRATQFFEAAGNDRCVQPGRSFMLAGHFSRGMRWPVRDMMRSEPIGTREYLIVSATHSASNNIHSADRAPSYYKNEFVCQRKTIRWRPGRHFHSEPPPAPGVQTAIVTGPAGEEIHTDGYGRITLQFHWDRKGKHDENSSTWIRVAMPVAGGFMGQVGLPRVGQEVVVQFLAENPDRPIVTGIVYNGDRRPPWELPAQRALSGLRSRELKGSRSNQLVLDDTPNAILAQLRSDHQHSQLTLGHIHRLETTAGHQEARGEGWELRTDGHGVARAARGLLLTSESRSAGSGPVKAMNETVQRLEQAHALHEALANLAQQHDANGGTAQADVATAVAKQNDGVKGTGDKFPELSAPHLVLASPAGIAATSAQSVHLAAGEQVAVTAGANVSVTAGGGLFASVRQGMRMFVHKAGMKLIAAAGDVDVQALSNSINLLAKLNITQSASRITITAKDEIVINGGGSYIKLADGGIEQGSKGNMVFHGAKHEFLGAKNMNVAVTMPAQADLKGKGMFNLGSHAAAGGRAQAGVPFKLYKDGAVLEEGTLDEQGNMAFQHELEEDAKYMVELPSGDTYDVESGEKLDAHQISSGIGHHGYQAAGATLTEDPASLERDRLDDNPSMRNWK